MSILSFLNPFAKAVASDLDAEVKAIQDKATADIAAAKLNAGRKAASTARSAQLAAWQAVKADYEKYLNGPVASSPSSASTSSTGPTGA